MSDEAPKKKGGKLPIIIGLVVMLGGGGFFMMKGKKPDKEATAVTLGEAEVLLPDEFIVNMADNKTYVRAKIALRPKKDFKPEEITHHDAEISDAIVRILKTTKPEDTVTELQIGKLKKKIAAALNHILEQSGHDAEADSKKKKKKKKGSTSDHAAEDETPVDEEDIPEGWDSADGPILKVFFKTLATQ